MTVSVLVVMAFGLATAGQRSKNEALSDAMSPYEDMAEFAMKNDAEGVKNSLEKASYSLKKLKTVLPQQIFDAFQGKYDGITAAAAKGDYPAVAVLAVDSYKILIDMLDTHGPDVPKEVALLDYAGFKTEALLNMPNPDWQEIFNVANEADINWSVIRGQVLKKSLRDSVDTAVAGLKNAARLRDADMSAFAAQVNMDLVDLLEKYYGEEDD